MPCLSIHFDLIDIMNLSILEDAIQSAKHSGKLKAVLVISIDKSVGIHPQHGVPQLYFDQLHVIANHLQAINKDMQTVDTLVPPNLTVQLTRTNHPLLHLYKLILHRSVIHLEGEQLSPRSNFYNAMTGQSGNKAYTKCWTNIMIKGCSQIRYHCQNHPMHFKCCGCNGSPRQQGTITLGHTYANALDAASEKLVWAICEKEGLVAYGANVSNAFAEAPPPKAPLYLYIDDAFRDWWENHLHRPPIPQECNVVRVHNAIKGHPEASHLWEKHIDKILCNTGLRPTTHEPCMYQGIIKTIRVIFLRQVDDFAVASRNATVCQYLLDQIKLSMRIPLKTLGIVTCFNGNDIHQTREFIKITQEKYLTKMLHSHGWTTPASGKPIPLPSDSKWIQQLETADHPTTLVQQQDLCMAMGFNYHQVIGEVIYPVVKAHPDICFHAVKLSQYMENPGLIHYHALRELCSYLAATITDGIYYWRDEPRLDLPREPLPTLHADNYCLEVTPSHMLYGYAETNWALDKTHRKSVSGIVIMYAGSAVGYKSKYQENIAHSTTEAEFTAACIRLGPRGPFTLTGY